MEPRSWIGLSILLVGIALQPVGWMYHFWVQMLSFGLIALGLFIFITQKYLDRQVEREFSSGKDAGPGLPGDVHNYSGWGQGGRSESWSSEHGAGAEGGGD